MVAELLIQISVDFAKALVEPVPVIVHGAIKIILCKFLESFNFFELSLDTLAIFDGWIHFDLIVL